MAHSSTTAPARGAQRAPFLPYIHAFRAIAIIGVVASHLDLDWPPRSLFGMCFLSTAQNASVLFLFVAGFLFQHLSFGFGYKKYLDSKLRNVIVPYVVISAPEILYQYVRHWGIFAADYPRQFANPFLHIGWVLMTAGHMPAPMWFIPTISVLYLAAPILIAIDRRPRLYWIIIPLLAIAMVCHRPLPVNGIGQALVYFTPAYLSGMWFSHYRVRVLALVTGHVRPVLLAYVAIEVFQIVVLKRSGPVFSRTPFSMDNGVVDLNLPNKILLAFGLVGLLARYPAAVGTRLDYLAGASFGVFFVHQYFVQAVELLYYRWQHRTFDGNVMNAFTLLAGYLLASLCTVAVVRAVMGRYSRYLVGC